MKQSVNLQDFAAAFPKYGCGDIFTKEAIKSLYTYLTDREKETGVELTLDVVDICLSFGEGAPEDVAEYFSIDSFGLNCDALVALLTRELTISGDLVDSENYCLVYKRSRG